MFVIVTKIDFTNAIYKLDFVTSEILSVKDVLIKFNLVKHHKVSYHGHCVSPRCLHNHASCCGFGKLSSNLKLTNFCQLFDNVFDCCFDVQYSSLTVGKQNTLT